MRAQQTAPLPESSVDADVEQQRLRAPSLGSEGVPVRKSCAHVLACVLAQLCDEGHVGGNQSLGDDLADEVGEALSDAARGGAPEAEDAFRRDADPAGPLEGEAEAAPLGGVEGELVG
jgi:hypothetical protein